MQFTTKAALAYWIASGHRTAQGDNSCVDAVKKDDGVHLTSTIAGNDGKVVYTQEEWDTFLLRALTSDEWLHTLSDQARAALEEHREELRQKMLAALRAELSAEQDGTTKA